VCHLVVFGVPSNTFPELSIVAQNIVLRQSIPNSSLFGSSAWSFTVPFGLALEALKLSSSPFSSPAIHTVLEGHATDSSGSVLPAVMVARLGLGSGETVGLNVYSIPT
jgi:hypothetical protein